MGYINIEQNKNHEILLGGVCDVPTGNTCGIHLRNEL